MLSRKGSSLSNSVSLGSSNQLSIGMLLGVRACVSVRVRVRV